MSLNLVEELFRQSSIEAANTIRVYPRQGLGIAQKGVPTETDSLKLYLGMLAASKEAY